MADVRRPWALRAAARDRAPLLDRIASIGADPRDDELTQLRKQVLNLATALIAAVSPVWVGAYAALGLWVAAAIPFAWMVATATQLTVQARRPSYRRFRFTELSMMLVLPFALQAVLGGFAAGSAVCLWALAAPLGAVFFIGLRGSVPWFAAYVALLLVSAALEPLVGPPDPPMPEPVRVAFFVINLAAVSATAFLLVEYFVRAREAEHERSESLLLNVLPAPVAQRLKRTPGVIADAHAEVSVLFADVVGFTPLAERMDPERLVALLDDVFTRWDALAQRHGLEKIKTVGDEYMAVAGVPHPLPDHAAAAARMALEMRAELTACATPETGPLRVRIGIDSGPVIAGVIGRSKFIYDLWGDTVNTASRMESSGEPDRIQVTPRTRDRLAGEFELRPRGEIEVKGKGRLTTYFLEAG